MRHAFTVDVEEWYQGIPIPRTAWVSAERRLAQGLDALLEALEETHTRATFFVLGPVAKEYPQVVERIAKGGHEIGCHGWSHDLVYRMGPDRFRSETQRAMNCISDITGRPTTAYRAAYFSVTNASLWALEILASLGFRYDSSIFPVRNWRYGIPDFEARPRRLETPSGPIFEFPISVRRVLGRNLPASGGAYFRIFPYALTHANIAALERAGRPVVFYLHPWELDPAHPRVKFHWKARLTHYVNLRSTRPKLSALLRDFDFGPLGDVLENEFREPSPSAL
jgi:polysaccharide deacetylase family protein (PEP-CTERM system associated)